LRIKHFQLSPKGEQRAGTKNQTKKSEKMGIYDVPAGLLIEEVAKDLKTKIKKPAFTDYVKTGAQAERAPNNPDWFYVRAASVLYRIYKEGNSGTGALRTYYGGRRNRGVQPEKKRKASGKIIRTCLQILEKEGLLKKDKAGRKISPKGEKYLFEKSRVVQIVFDETLLKAKQKEQEEFTKRAAAAQKISAPKVEPKKDQKPEVKKEQKPTEQNKAPAQKEAAVQKTQENKGATEK